MPSRSLRAPLAALLIAGAGGVLLLVGVLGADGRSAAVVAALSTAAAVAGAWLLGALPPAADRPAGTGRPRRRAGLWSTAAFLVSLGAGTLLAALPSTRGPGAPAFPPSLSALVVGVFLAPLLLTSLGFALSFRPPSANDLDRLRRAAGATPGEDDAAR